MGIKIYISGISGNKEVKKRQQRVLMILDSKNIKYDVVDIAEPGNEDAKEFMQNNAKSFGATVGDANPRSPLPPQIFNDNDYCGDYDQFDMSNENDEIEKFLKLPYENNVSVAAIKLENGDANAEEVPKDKEVETKDNELETKALQKEEAKEQEIAENNEDHLEDDTDNKESAEEVTPSEVKEEEIKKPVEDDTAKDHAENELKEENGIGESEAVEA